MISFGTKAETLARLEGNTKQALVLPQVSFCIAQWQENQGQILDTVIAKFKDRSLVVRSSAINEDTAEESKAGQYTSVIDVKTRQEIIDAVNTVSASYQNRNEKDQILIQPMLQHVISSGVAFTLDPNTLGNYYVINYDDITGSTESVTSGSSEKTKLQYVFKGYRSPNDPFISKLCDTLRELEGLFGQPNLDVEFAMDSDKILYIFQVRPLCVAKQQVLLEEQNKYLQDISQKIERENCEKPFLYGKKTVYGIMPDWNPAEIIGVRPKPLALSLYKEIVTDNIWAYQRDNYGYRNLRSFPLMIDFYGLPYIDVRVSFNSFIPAQLNPETAEKLVTYYLKKLYQHPDLHDKIEFDIAFTCYTPDLPDRIKCLYDYGFSNKEITEIMDSLRNVTNTIIDNEEGLWKKDYRKIQTLEERYREITESSLDNVSKIYWLIEDCKRYGTLPFAGLARAGFIAVQLLKSLVNMEILSEEEYQEFMGELNTVSSIMKRDKREMSKKAFLTKYGHLRPGTYDICSRRYDEAEDVYFDWENEWTQNIDGETAAKGTPFKISLTQIKKLNALLKEHGMADDILGFFHFIKTAIEGREYAKFVFTKSLSEAIRLFGQLGKENDLSEEECAYSDINIISELYASSMNCRDILLNSIQKGKEKYRITKCMVLPPLIFHADDIYCFRFMDTQPNYITLKQVLGEVYEIRPETEYDLSGKIVLMESADPGYDWIFSHKIIGFITKYGGANSHMAIRANELQIPAVIGTGESLYENIKKAKVIQIDAAGRRIDVLK